MRVSCISDLDFSFMEMNPFTIDPATQQPFPLDMRGALDDTAAYRQQRRWGDAAVDFPMPFGRRLSPAERTVSAMDERTGASLKLTILNPRGSIWTMVAGGGASVIYAGESDAMSNARTHSQSLPFFFSPSLSPSLPFSLSFCLSLFLSLFLSLSTFSLSFSLSFFLSSSLPLSLLPPLHPSHRFISLRHLPRYTIPRSAPKLDMLTPLPPSLPLSLSLSFLSSLSLSLSVCVCVYLDTVGDLGCASMLGNYAEYSGAPNAEETYAFSKTLIQCATWKEKKDGKEKEEKEERRAIIVGGGIANFSESIPFPLPHT